MGLMKFAPPITEKTYQEHASRWLEVLNHRESGAILNLTRREQPRRIHQLFEDTKTLKKYQKNYQTTQNIILDIASFDIESAEDLNDFLSKTIDKNKKYINLFVLGADELIYAKTSLLTQFDEIFYTKHICLIYFFQKNILLPHFVQKFSSISTLYQNIFLFPYYETSDCNQFVKYLEEKFHVCIPANITSDILTNCGGFLGFIKQAVRQYLVTKNKKEIYNHPEMVYKLKSIYDEFEDVEKKVLEKITSSNYIFDDSEMEVIKYFIDIRLVKKIKNTYRLTMPILESYIKSECTKKNYLTFNNQKQLTINGVITDSFFSKRERKFLKSLIVKRNILILRDESSKIIWGQQSDEKYTDWALDQFIKRLRNKFERLGLPQTLIKTIKNQGFILLQP